MLYLHCVITLYLEDCIFWIFDGQPVEHGERDIGNHWFLHRHSRKTSSDGRGRGNCMAWKHVECQVGSCDITCYFRYKGLVIL